MPDMVHANTNCITIAAKYVKLHTECRHMAATKTPAPQRRTAWQTKGSACSPNCVAVNVHLDLWLAHGCSDVKCTIMQARRMRKAVAT